MRYVDEDEKMISRRGFLKVGSVGILGAILLLLSGCGGEFEDDDDDGGRRRRRRR